MTYGSGWPFSDMPDGYAAEAQDEADAEQAEREAREDRLADYAPAGVVPFIQLNAAPARVGADYVRGVLGA